MPEELQGRERHLQRTSPNQVRHPHLNRPPHTKQQAGPTHPRPKDQRDHHR